MQALRNTCPEIGDGWNPFVSLCNRKNLARLPHSPSTSSRATTSRTNEPATKPRLIKSFLSRITTSMSLFRIDHFWGYFNRPMRNDNSGHSRVWADLTPFLFRLLKGLNLNLNNVWEKEVNFDFIVQSFSAVPLICQTVVSAINKLMKRSTVVRSTWGFHSMKICFPNKLFA